MVFCIRRNNQNTHFTAGASHAQLKKRITKNDNGVTFKCVATNAVGSGEDSIQLNVHCKF